VPGSLVGVEPNTPMIAVLAAHLVIAAIILTLLAKHPWGGSVIGNGSVSFGVK
jgi:hypothetical protein